MKKGFTLLELLAVIVVLAIIALIVTPFVTKAIENARKGAFKSSAYGIINAAEIYYASNMIKEEVTSKLFTITNGKFVSGEEELIFEGKAPTQGTVMIRNDGKISLNVSDGVYRAEKTIEQQEVSISLATAPSSDELALQLENLRQEMQSLNASLGNRVTAVETNSNDKWEEIYPIGSIYTSVSNTSPATLFGGTWVAFGEGRTLVGVKSGDTDFATVEQQGGAKTHTLTVGQIPAHQHESPFPINGIAVGNEHASTGFFYFNRVFGQGRTASATGAVTEFFMDSVASAAEGDEVHPYVSSTGSSQAHNNLQPYVTVYMWKRTA